MNREIAVALSADERARAAATATLNPDSLFARLLSAVNAAEARAAEAEADVAHLRYAVSRLVGDQPCRYDHHGNCQEHGLGNPCEVATASGILAEIERPRG